MALAAGNLAKIQAASRSNVVKTLSGISSFLEDKRWTGPRNIYAKDVIESIKLDISAGSVRYPKQLAQYISTSSILHCADGWSYLGAAVSALLHGDPHRTRHLAYYAELRAAMSLLASFGIGVFKDVHFVIDAPDAASRFPSKSGTHRFVWDCFEYYGTQNSLGDLFASVMTPNGFTLSDWLYPIGGSGFIAAQAREWFLQWGIDLQMPERDHDARNESSYRPDGLPDSWHLDAHSVLGFVHDLWASLEPSPQSHFATIDRHIFRVALEKSYKARYGRRAVKSRPSLQQVVNQVVQRQTLDAALTKAWQRFLLRKDTPADHILLRESRRSPEIRDGSDKAVLARATLLLRAASGSARQLFQHAGISPVSISFWRGGLAQDRGLQEAADDDVDPMDFWADVEPLLRDIEVFQENRAPANQTFLRIGRELGQAVVELGTCDRVALWSLGS